MATTRKAKPGKKAPKKAVKKAARRSRKASAKASRKTSPTFGRPGTAGKGEGHAIVKRWIASVKPEHKPVVERIERIIAEEVPDARYALKWSSPMFGREGKGWFASMASFKAHVGVNFFNGVSLKPQPPGSGKGMRSVRIEGPEDLDEPQLRDWVRQAASNPGWGKV